MVTICNFLRWFCLQSVNRAHAFHGCAVDTQRTHQLHKARPKYRIVSIRTCVGHIDLTNRV